MDPGHNTQGNSKSRLKSRKRAFRGCSECTLKNPGNIHSNQRKKGPSKLKHGTWKTKFRSPAKCNNYSTNMTFNKEFGKKWNVKCPYCKKTCDLAEGPQGIIYICGDCDAYVGTHQRLDANGFRKPLGTPADAELRKFRMSVHNIFDSIWQHKITTRQQLYKKLAKEMKMSNNRCHIGKFNKKQCLRALKKISEFQEFSKLLSQYSSRSESSGS